MASFLPIGSDSGQRKNPGLQSATVMGDSPSEEAKHWQKQKTDLIHCVPTLMDAEKSTLHNHPQISWYCCCHCKMLAPSKYHLLPLPEKASL